MKKLLLFFLVLAQTTLAQQVSVLSIEKIKATDTGGYFYPRISPDNQFMLMTRGNYSGLYQYSLADKKLKTLNEDPGAGYKVQISEDCSTVLYTKTELIRKLRHNSLISQTISTGERKVLVSPTRDAITARMVNSRPVYVRSRNMVKAKSLKSTDNVYVITIENRKMVLYKNGNRTELTPNGADVSYIWASISPDNKNIVYTAAGKGTFVCSVTGKNVTSLGKLSAPSWAGNKYVVGMDDRDDGEKLISSSLVVSSIDGKLRKTLETPTGINAMYPTASKDGSRIVFNTDKGEVYLMHVELK